MACAGTWYVLTFIDICLPVRTVALYRYHERSLLTKGHKYKYYIVAKGSVSVLTSSYSVGKYIDVLFKVALHHFHDLSRRHLAHQNPSGLKDQEANNDS